MRRGQRTRQRIGGEQDIVGVLIRGNNVPKNGGEKPTEIPCFNALFIIFTLLN